jgi:hypothetical protein
MHIEQLEWTKRIDFSRPFMPEEFTHLHGSASYARLTQAQRLRYNQLCGLMTAEQFVAFEEDVIFRCVSNLRKSPEVIADRTLSQQLDGMLAEERQHAAMFRGLLMRGMPEIYRDRKRYFTRLGRAESLLAEIAARTRSGTLALLWFSLAIEEHSVSISRAMESEPPGPLGDLESTFVAVHSRHLRDEISHLPLNQALIERVFDKMKLSTRRRLAWVFGIVLGNISRPRRANRRVIDHLVSEFPELRPEQPEMIRTILVDAKRLAPRSDITSMAHHPITAEAWRQREEFAPLVRRLSGGCAFEPGSLQGSPR